MDTNTTISTIQSLRNSVAGNVSGLQSQITAIDISLGIINATLQTQLSSVTDDQFNALPQAVALKQALATANDTIANLQTQIIALTPVAPDPTVNTPVTDPTPTDTVASDTTSTN